MQGYYYEILHNNQPTHYEDITDHPHVVKKRIKVCYSSLINVESNHPAWENCIFGEYLRSLHSGRECTKPIIQQSTKQIEGDWRYMLRIHAYIVCIYQCIFFVVYIMIYMYALSSFMHTYTCIYKWEWQHILMHKYDTIQRNMI